MKQALIEKMRATRRGTPPSVENRLPRAAHRIAERVVSQDNGSSEVEACRGPRIWAVGGGKGGVGKSVITSSIAIKMARSGERVVVVDADLGGANLHTVLGVRHPGQTLSHFLNNEVASLQEVMCAGPVPNLSLISGAQALYEMANPKYSRMRKLLRHIQQLDVDHVFLDLGAGSAFNVLDFFLAAHRGIMVIVPEPTSIENAYHFMKAAFFRALRTAAKTTAVRLAINHVLIDREQRRVRSPRQLVEAIRAVDPAAAVKVQEQARAFAPLLIVNQVRTVEHRPIGRDVAIACREFLGTRVEFIGALERDECVRTAVAASRPVVETFPRCDFSRDLGQVVDRLKKEDSHDCGTPEEPGCTFRYGRAIYGDAPLAVHGLLPDEMAAKGRGDAKVANSSQPQEEALKRTEGVQCAQQAELAIEGLPELPTAPVKRGPLPPPDLEAPGAYLRSCREHLGLEIAEIARRTRILCLQGIESEQYDAVPPEPYIRGFVVNYGRSLGVADPEAVAAAFVRRLRLACAVKREPARRRFFGRKAS